MSFEWLKRYMPRGLYGRAALILVLPVVMLQLLVSIVFIQRHFEGVTEQMARAVVQEIRLLQTTPDALERARMAEALDYTLTPVPMAQLPDVSERRWFDFSGIVVIRELTMRVPQIQAVSLPNDREALVYLAMADGPMEVQFDRSRVSASNPHQLLVNMIVFGALMTIIAFVYLRNQLRPITRLAKAAEAFGRGRHIAYKPSGAIEVRAAGNAFLDMRQRLERQMEQRTLMLSGVSHDLRTPLTRLKLGLSMSDDPGAEDMSRDVTEMERMLDEFLDFARGDAQQAEPESVDPEALVRAIVSDAQRAGKQVDLETIEGAGDVMLRPLAIRRCIENLIGNATRYGTRAQVSLFVTDRALRIRVEDDGPGIAPAEREAAMRPFVRLDVARNQDRGSGVGLGLAIASDIARAHGGMLRLAESQTLGGLAADLVIAR
ncbi:ATP-binding protein [Primorskyibacter sp. S187A]|uniref:ATP-binding protein n=1 Tax=Primorskyibacter sp. S187A TaxID=3415130 RepID=UPI003C79D6BB